MINNSQRIAEILLDTQAVQLNVDSPFQWSSGWNSPIYCDNRITLSYPEERSYIRGSLTRLIREKFGEPDTIAGVATAGIPQGALVADEMEIPFIYVRSKPKAHGMQNMIEGKADKGASVVLIEDLISTGGSSLKAAEALQEAGLKVLGLVAIFTYGFDLSLQNFKEAEIPFYCLSNYDVLSKIALERNYIDQRQLELLQSWRSAPDQWGK